MINKLESRLIRFCKKYKEIENYEKAIADKEHKWVCHHRDEIRILPSGIIAIRSKQYLIDNGRYYDCPPNELIFLKNNEHISLHRKYEDEYTHIKRKSRKLTKEQKDKISKATKEAMNDKKLKEHLSKVAKKRIKKHPIKNADWKKGKHKVINKDGNVSWEA